jgi:hypothetical protein
MEKKMYNTCHKNSLLDNLLRYIRFIINKHLFTFYKTGIKEKNPRSEND